MLWLPLCPHLALFFFMALIPIWDHITNLFLYLFVFCLPIKICHRTQKGRDLITYSLLFVTYSLLFPQGLLRWLMYNRHFMQIDNFDFSFALHTFAFSYYFAFHQQKQMIYNKCPAEQFRNFIITNKIIAVNYNAIPNVSMITAMKSKSAIYLFAPSLPKHQPKVITYPHLGTKKTLISKKFF